MKDVNAGSVVVALCRKDGSGLIIREAGSSRELSMYLENLSGIEDGDILLIRAGDSDKFSIEKRYTHRHVINRFIRELDRLHVRINYPPEVMREADRIILSPGMDDKDIEDYTALPFVTIDNDGSRDLDQAVYVERDGPGYRIWYAIADASYYVKPGSALFSESLKRGASFYLPSFTVPMLPPELSEGIISLNPDVKRRSLLFIMKIDGRGICLSTEIKRGVIISRGKLSYSGVQEFYDDPAAGSFHGREFEPSLLMLQEAGRLLAGQSAERGVISFERNELEAAIESS